MSSVDDNGQYNTRQVKPYRKKETIQNERTAGPNQTRRPPQGFHPDPRLPPMNTKSLCLILDINTRTSPYFSDNLTPSLDLAAQSSYKNSSHVAGMSILAS